MSHSPLSSQYLLQWIQTASQGVQTDWSVRLATRDKGIKWCLIFDPNHKWQAKSVFCHSHCQTRLSLKDKQWHREQYCILKPISSPADFHSVCGKYKQESAPEVLVISDQQLTRRQCLITAATSSWMSSFFAMSSTCCMVSGRGSGLLSLTPARVSLGDVRSWKGRPPLLSKELKWRLK